MRKAAMKKKSVGKMLYIQRQAEASRVYSLVIYPFLDLERRVSQIATSCLFMPTTEPAQLPLAAPSTYAGAHCSLTCASTPSGVSPLTWFLSKDWG